MASRTTPWLGRRLPQPIANVRLCQGCRHFRRRRLLKIKCPLRGLRTWCDPLRPRSLHSLRHGFIAHHPGRVCSHLGAGVLWQVLAFGACVYSYLSIVPGAFRCHPRLAFPAGGVLLQTSARLRPIAKAPAWLHDFGSPPYNPLPVFLPPTAVLDVCSEIEMFHTLWRPIKSDKLNKCCPPRPGKLPQAIPASSEVFHCSTEFGRIRSKCDRLRSTLGECCQFWPTFEQFRSNLGRSWPNLSKLRPKLTTSRPTLANIGQFWPISAKMKKCGQHRTHTHTHMACPSGCTTICSSIFGSNIISKSIPSSLFYGNETQNNKDKALRAPGVP